MFNRILVPLDGSILAEQAIPHAERFARIFNSNIILLQVLDPISYQENPTSVDPLNWQIHKTETDMYMSSVAERIRGHLLDGAHSKEMGASSQVEYALREGNVAENIINFAHTENIELVVISTHGSGGLSRWRMSSITQKVIDLVYLPVLIVRTNRQPEEEDARIHYKRILLPLDSSRRAECALSAGIALARGELPTEMALEDNPTTQVKEPVGSEATTTLILAAVIKPPELPIPEPYPADIENLSQQFLRISRQAVNAYLNELRARLPVKCEISVSESLSVSTAIQDLASQDEEIDLVVLCAHGYTGLSTWPYGTVARNYMEHGTKTALVIQDLPLYKIQQIETERSHQEFGGRPS
jgi:nucleotide-binding universal stress UspA family protein